MRSLLVSALLLATASAVLNAQQGTPSLDRIVARYIEARGGMERIKSIRNLVLHGPARPDGRPGRWMVKARPYYFLVGRPGPNREFAEGYDGSSWEYYRDPGLVMRTTDAPAAASRHTAYFDDPLVYFGEPGWRFLLRGNERIGSRPAYWIHVKYPDGFEREVYVDHETWLVTAYRWTAQIHAFGDVVKSETRVLDYRSVNGVLFPTRYVQHDIATGKAIEDGPGWERIEANVELAMDFFAPPPEPATPIARMVNAAYMSRAIPSDALLWYTDFRSNPRTRDINTEQAVEALGYQCLKNGAVDTSVLLLEANLRDYPNSAAAHFGLGRAYRTAGREADAVKHFRRALEIDPAYKGAADALAATKSSPQ